MKRKSPKILPLFLTLALGFSLFTFTPASVSAADISIDVPGDWPASNVISLNNGDSLTIGPSAGSPAAATCIAIAADANVTINGNGQMIDKLYLSENPGDTQAHTVTINNLRASTETITYSTYSQYMGMLNLKGNNEFFCNQWSGYYPLHANGGTINVTSSTGGKLLAQSGRGIISDLSLQGNAELTSVINPASLNHPGLASSEIIIARNAKLNVTGGTTFGISSLGNLLINNNGTLTVQGGAGNNALKAASGSPIIYMGVGAETNLTNMNTAAAYDFYMASAGSGYWRAANGAIYYGFQGNDVATVTFPLGSMGTLALDPLVKFDANGGKFSDLSTIIEKAIPSGKKVGTLPVPARKGFTFMGFFTAKTGGSKITKDTVITSPKTFYARWASNNAYLKGLKVSKGKLNKKFSKTRYSYTLKLDKLTATVKFTPVKANSKAKVQVKVGKKWKAVKKSYTTPKLIAGTSRTVIFKVTAADGKTTKTYKVKVSRSK